MKNKPKEIKNKIPDAQLSLFDDSRAEMPPKKLRVEWSLRGPATPFIPTDKSVPEDSSIYMAWRDGGFTIGEDRLDLVNVRGIVRCENQPFEANDERFVLSLLHLSSDE